MNGQAQLTAAGDCLSLSGALDFGNLVALQREGDQWLRERAPVHCRLDLSGVKQSNSAGAALLLAWQRTARSLGKHLRIEQIPDNLAAIIHLGGLDMALLSA